MAFHSLSGNRTPREWRSYARVQLFARTSDNSDVREIVPPVFVIHDDADLSVHRSIDDALAYVEPWDVTPSLRVFDSRGTCFRFREEGVIRTKRTVAGGQTLLDESFPGDERPRELVEILRDWISQVGPQLFGLSEDAASRGELADLANAVAAFSGIE